MKLFLPVMLLIAIGIGYLCAQTSPTVDRLNQMYTKEESKIDKLISIFEDWKDKDTRDKL